MKDSLCVILSSVYPSHINLDPWWNDEVKAEIENIREILSLHCDLIEIKIPIHAKNSKIIEPVQNSLHNIFCSSYKSCHIVLNTHGVPGKSDLQSHSVKLTVQILSEKNIVISQISALICDAMSIRLGEFSLNQTFNTQSKNNRSQISGMMKLQMKLQKMKTHTVQHFNIYGVDQAYDPVKDRVVALSILRADDATSSLSVTTRFAEKEVSSFPSRERIVKNLGIVQTRCAETKEGRKEYSLAAFELHHLLLLLKQQIVQELTLKSGCYQLQRSQPLYDALTLFNGNKGLTATNVVKVFSSWLKVCKARSPERLAVFESFIS